jgi:hypothetical protein
MNGNSRTSSENRDEITIDSDRTTTFLLALLFIICALLLAREIRNSVHGHLILPQPVHRTFFSIFTKASEGIVAIYLFVSAFSFPKKSVKLASVLLGTSFISGLVVLSWPHFSLPTQHAVAIARSGAQQVAFAIILVKIAEWFRSVVRWVPRSNTQLGG